MKSSLFQSFVKRERKSAVQPLVVYRVVLPWSASPNVSDWHLRMHLQQMGWCSQLGNERLVHEQMLFFLYLWSECDQSWSEFCKEYHDSFEIVPFTTLETKRKYLWIHHDDSEDKAFPMRLFDIHSLSSFLRQKHSDYKCEEESTCPLIGQVAQW
jgi:hypothetical protein